MTTATTVLDWQNTQSDNFQTVHQAIDRHGRRYVITTALAMAGTELTSWLTITSTGDDGTRTTLHQDRYATTQGSKVAAAAWFKRHPLTEVEFAGPEHVEGATGTEHIQAAILTLIKTGTWASLAGLRAKFGTSIARDRIDQALTDLVTARKIILIPEANQKTLTDADWNAALWLGGEYRHLAALPNIR